MSHCTEQKQKLETVEPSQQFPPEIPSPGLSLQRQQHLYKVIQYIVSNEKQYIVVPMPISSATVALEDEHSDDELIYKFSKTSREGHRWGQQGYLCSSPSNNFWLKTGLLLCLHITHLFETDICT